MPEFLPLEVSFTYPIDLLCKYHPLSGELNSHKKDNNEATCSIVLSAFDLEIFDQTAYDEFREIGDEDRAVRIALKNHELFGFNSARLLGASNFRAILAIVNAYIQNEFRLAYFQEIEPGNHGDLDEIDRSKYDYAKKNLKNLRNLLYIRDVYKGEVKIKFECNSISKNHKGQDIYGDKDPEYSVLFDYKEEEVINAAIKSLAFDILTQSRQYIGYLSLLYLDYKWNPTFAEVKTILESVEVESGYYQKRLSKLESVEVESGYYQKRLSKMNLFRGHLVSVLTSFIEQEGTLVKLNKSEKSALIFDILGAFGMITLERRISSIDNKSKFDYLKGLPKKGFLILEKSDEIPEHLSSLKKT